MESNISMITFFLFFVLYWRLLGEVVGSILERPRLKTGFWFFAGVFNAFVLIGFWSVYPKVEFSFGVMMVLMLAEFVLLFRDRFAGALLCVLACGFHVIAVFIMALSTFFLNTGRIPVDVLTSDTDFLWCFAGVFFLLDLCIFCVLKLIPLPKVKLINQHREQQWFMNAWMIVSCLCLIYMESLLYLRPYPAKQAICQIVVCMALMTDLYIVLFFAIKTSALLGYREKNEKLKQVIHKEQEYRSLMVRDAVASYEINITQDMIIKGFEEQRMKMEGAICSYTDMLLLISRQFIHSGDISAFTRDFGRTNIIRLFEKGERELVTEYRWLLKKGEYIWVRSNINLLKDTQTGDIKAFVCVKNVDGEKKKQLKLQHQAERDPLTGLYNRSSAENLIDEHLTFSQNTAGSALFMIDVDNFKKVNDHMGHIFGDAVLCELADKLIHIFGNKDITARIGGDEYIAFCKDCVAIQDAEEKAEEICRAFYVTYQCDDAGVIAISGSVGVALFPRDGSNFQELYAHADIALYSTKNNGKNGYKIYNGSSFAAHTPQYTKIRKAGNCFQKGVRDNRIEYVFKMLYQSETPVMSIHSVLELVAGHFSFERGYIFETSKDGKSSSNTFEWCAEGIIPRISSLQNIPIEALEFVNCDFNRYGTLVLKSLDDLAPDVQAMLELQGIKSMMWFGIFDKSRLLGFIGFDNCKNETALDDNDIDEIKTICNILGTFIARRYLDEVSAKNMLARQEVMDHLENYIYVINAESFELLFMNEKIQIMLNKAKEGDSCYLFFRGNTEQCEDCPLRRLLNTDLNHITCEMYNDKLGIWMETSASLMRWEDGSLACLLNCADITKQKEAQLQHIHELEQSLYVDALTGCPTYHRFRIDAQHILEKQAEESHLLVILDIDNFKLINQMYGYDKGNDVLCSVAKALEKTVRSGNEPYARVGNDEFVALFTVSDENEIGDISEGFISYFHQLFGSSFPFRFRFPQGRYLITPDDAKVMGIHDMYEKANIAHKAAKLGKIVDFACYDESMTRKALCIRTIENKMAQALADNEFCVYLQPKYYLKNETIGGAEALTRWKTKNKDLFFPDAFIPVFEQNGFITKLDLHVFEKTCKIIKSWISQGIDPVTVSVNFSRLHIDNADFIKRLCEIADGVGIERKYLEIEITETVIYDNIDLLEILLDEIHKSGFSMSMDDFGSGYSSLGMLKDIPVDVIKMDRSFFVNQRDAGRSRIVVGSIIKMASELGIRIVAEGVEEQAHIDFLRELNCDMVQGYYYAKPMPANEFTQLLLGERKKGLRADSPFSR